MSEIIQRGLISAGFGIIAGCLVYLGEPVWSLIPAAVAVYVAGSLFWDVWRKDV
ncbi:MAG: hypothetical protein ABSE80_14775 [Halobacteriota archaeon]|jgi:hypothetical protein